jgi:hypothetical protein
MIFNILLIKTIYISMMDIKLALFSLVSKTVLSDMPN